MKDKKRESSISLLFSFLSILPVFSYLSISFVFTRMYLFFSYVSSYLSILFLLFINSSSSSFFLLISPSPYFINFSISLFLFTFSPQIYQFLLFFIFTNFSAFLSIFRSHGTDILYLIICFFTHVTFFSHVNAVFVFSFYLFFFSLLTKIPGKEDRVCNHFV